jgi:hypothetical protein
MSKTYETIRAHMDDKVATLTLNPLEKMNHLGAFVMGDQRVLMC